MATVQFAPKVSPDIQVDADWRRQSNGASVFNDLLADQMKRRADEARQELDAQRRANAKPPKQSADRVSGQPPQVTVSHPKTIRGEAKRVDDTADDTLPDKSDPATGDAAKTAAGAAAKEDDDKDQKKGAAAKAEAEPAEAQCAQAADGQQQPTDPVAPVVVVAVQQPADQNVAAPAPQQATPGLALPAPAAPDGQATLPLPGQPAEAKDAAASAGNIPATDGKPQQAAVAGAAAATDLSAALAAQNTSEPAAAPGAQAPAAAPLAVATAVTQPAAKQQPLQIQLAPTPAESLTPPIQQQAARPAVETRLRPGTPAHAAAEPSETASAPAATPSTAPTHAATPVQPVGTTESTSDGDGFDQPLSADGSAPGWTLHLAQGAVGKRADFVNQLRQHLQNLPMQEQVAVHIQRALRDGAGKVSIQLSPAELGRIQVKLDIDEDKRVTAAVTVERPSTLELLQRDVKGLERALHDAGLNMDTGDLSFSLGQSSDHEFAQDLGGRSGTGSASALVSEAGSEGDQPERQTASVTDTAAGVVNVQV